MSQRAVIFGVAAGAVAFLLCGGALTVALFGTGGRPAGSEPGAVSSPGGGTETVAGTVAICGPTPELFMRFGADGGEAPPPDSPRYQVLVRTPKGDRVCLFDEDFGGQSPVEDGDRVVISGIPAPNGDLKHCKIRSRKRPPGW